MYEDVEKAEKSLDPQRKIGVEKENVADRVRMWKSVGLS